MLCAYQKKIHSTDLYFYTIYSIINEPLMLAFQYFVYLCDITITLIKRLVFLLNKLLLGIFCYKSFSIRLFALSTTLVSSDAR